MAGKPTVGPKPIPEALYVNRHLPTRVVVRWFVRVLGFLAVIVLALALFIALLYQLPTGNPLLRAFATILPLPAVRVDGHWIRYRHYDAATQGWLQYYDAQTVSIETDTIRERVLDQLIDRALAEQLADTLHVALTDEQRQETYRELVMEHESEARVLSDVDRLYGWSQDEFLTYIVEPIAQIQNLAPRVLENASLQQPIVGQLQRIVDELQGHPEQFADQALSVSTSPSAATGGELGLRPIDEYPTEVHDVFLSMEEGELTGIIELPTRFVVYRLIEVQERRGDLYVNAQELSLDKWDVHDVLAAMRAEATIRVFVQQQ